MKTANSLTLTNTIHLLKTKQLSHQELVDTILNELGQDDCHIYLWRNANAAKEGAALLDTPLAGAPIAVKDNICTKDIPTTASSLVLKDFKPQFDATVSRKLKAAGGVIFGKTNLDAWAHGSSTETSQYGRTLNPRNSEYLPGGSSGGSAAAIAANVASVAIGTETAGSIRQPSAWCGTVGLKPTYGRVSRYGIAAMASSTDSPGPIAKTVEDAALLLNHLAGVDVHDGTTSPQTAPDFTSFLNQNVKGLKVGIIYSDILPDEVTKNALTAAAKEFTKLGCEVDIVNAMDPKQSIGVYTVVQRSEVSSNLARYDGVRYGHGRDQFGDEAKRRIMLGTFTLSKGYADKYYQTAQKVRTLFINDFAKLFAKYDALISLSSPGFAKKVGATQGAAMFGELEDMLVEPSSITGLPGINVPCYHDPKTNLYLGLNIMTNMWREDTAIALADAYEKSTTWNEWRRHDSK